MFDGRGTKGQDEGPKFVPRPYDRCERRDAPPAPWCGWGDTPRTCFQKPLLHGDVRGGARDRALPLHRGPCEPPPGGRGGGTARLSVLGDTAPPLGVCAALLPRTWGFTEPPRPARLLRAPAGRPGPVALGRALSLCHGGARAGDRSHAATRILISERPDPLTTLRMGRPGLPSWSVHGRSWARQGREAPQGSLGSTHISPCQSVQAGGGPAAVCESRGKSASNTRIRRPSLERLSRRVWSENQKICLFFFLNKQSK